MRKWLRGLIPINNSFPHGTGLPATTFGFIWFFVCQARTVLILYVLAETLFAASQLAVPILVSKVVSAFSGGNIHTLIGQPTFWYTVALAIFFRPVAYTIHGFISANAYQPYISNLVRKQLHEYTLRQSLSFFQNDFAGRIASKLTEVGSSIRSILETTISALLFAFFIFLGSLILISTIHWSLTCILVGWLALNSIVAWRLMPKMRIVAAEAANMYSTSLGHRVDVYTHIPAVKLNGAEEAEMHTDLQHIYRQNEAYQRAEDQIFRIRFSTELTNTVLLVSMFSGCLILHLNGQLDAGNAALALTLTGQLLGMSAWVMSNISSLAENYGKITDAVQTLAKPLTVQDVPHAHRLKVTKGSIELQDVTYQYSRNVGGIANINLHIKPGERVGIIGTSGAGKSTLVGALARYFDLESGAIFIDGQNIAQVTQRSLRQAMGVITQEPEIFHRSIYANIAYGKPDATEEEVIAAAKAAHAHDFILNLQDPQGRQGYKAVVGERGIRLSGGQRQRIAIARTLLANRPILILDEATSALDSESEAAIQENLGLLMKNRTVIAIAHRLSTLKAMNRIVVMSQGKIIEEGSHKQLLAKKSIYAKMWALQTNGYLPEAEVKRASSSSSGSSRKR